MSHQPPEENVGRPVKGLVEALPPLREVIAAHSLSARKGLGQNFLLDLNLTRKIAGAAGDLRDAVVLEVGPGPGGLSRGLLLAGARQVIAVERDQRCIEALASLVDAAQGRLQLLAGDALELSETALRPAPSHVVANLPYNIATPLLLKWLTGEHHFERLILMFQKEVALRLAAKPGGKTYGRLSVMVQWRAQVRCLFDVPARAFTPPPKVTSTVVELIPHAQPVPAVDREALERIVTAAFAQRRKMLRAALRGVVASPENLLAAADIDPTRRAETLSLEEFCRLADLYAQGL